MGISRVALCAVLTACGGEVLGDGAELDATAEDLQTTAVQTTSLQEVELETGVKISYVEQGSRQGAPVLLLHGYTDSHHSFDLTLPRMPTCFHVFAIDQRGHGDSSKPECCYTQADFAGDVVAFMDALGIERASLVGHSMGSFIAQKVALEHPERVEHESLEVMDIVHLADGLVSRLLPSPFQAAPSCDTARIEKLGVSATKLAELERDAASVIEEARRMLAP